MTESASAVSDVLATMRRPRGEAQLTQLLAAFARSDKRFAAGLVRCFVAAAPKPEAAVLLDEIPDALECEAEHQAVDDRGADRGYIDLRFFDETGAFTVLVELKLHSGYGDQQLERYRATLGSLGGNASLMAMTTWLPSYGEEEVAQDPRWLGSGRWSQAYAGMMALEHSDPHLRDLWPELLTLIRKQGDFGVMDIDKSAVEGWARWKKGRGQLTALLTEIHPRTLDIVRSALARHAGVAVTDDLAADLRFKEKRLVWPWGESLNVQYAISATNSERLRVQFAGGRDELLFTVEARHGDDRVMSRATDELRASSEKLVARRFETGHWYGAYWARLHPLSEWIDASSIPDALIEFVRSDVHQLVGSGIFDALAELTERQPRAVPESEPD